MNAKGKLLEGVFVSLKPIDESGFSEIISWRNNPDLNRFLNQPYELNMELQIKWYEEKYLPSNDILFMMIDKKSGKKFGTIGINDVDYDELTAILGRLIVGEYEFRGSKEFIEAMVLIYDYIFFELGMKVLYGHCVRENENVISLDYKFGCEPTKNIKYPQYCFVNNMECIEMYNTKKHYEAVRDNFVKIIEYHKKQIGKIAKRKI